MASHDKLEEAQFFLELLNLLDQRKHSLTRSENPAKECSFLLAAILNAFYSCIVQMKEEGVGIRSFKENHPLIYAHGSGLRARTVHLEHVEPSFSGHIPPAGNAVGLNLKAAPKLVGEKQVRGQVHLRLGPSYYIDVHGKLIPIIDLLERHFYELRQFHSAAKTHAGAV